MRRDGIPYVKNPSVSYPPLDYTKMDLKELTERYIKACAKANGVVSTCSLCATPCEYGKRAIQLVANQVYNDPPIPLYGGKTLIERAKEENMRRREKEEAKKIEEKVTIKKKKTYLRGDGWWKASIEYGDQVEYLEKEYGFTKTKAKNTIYRYRSRHGLSGSPGTPGEKEAKTTPKLKNEEVIIEEEKPVIEQNSSAKGDVVFMTMEQKLNELIVLQDEYKANVEKYTKLYNETKEQVDTLCKAMELFQ